MPIPTERPARPLIGVLPLVDETKDSYWMLPGYFQGIQAAGGLPIMLPLTAEPAALARLAALCDGFLFTGGHDLSPSLYGQAALPVCGAPCPARDEMETALLPLVLQADKPVLGICRGIQLLNAALGGTLYQDLPSQRPSPLEHHQSPPYAVPVHSVALTPGAPLAALLGKQSLAVNSYHHQAICRLAPGLAPMAQAADGLIEAVYLPGKRFVWGVQWHPEFAYHTDPDSLAVLRAFVAACAGG